MKRIISTILIALAALVVLAAIIIGVFLDGIAKKTIETYGSGMTQASVTMDSIHLSLLTGSAKVKGLVVGNPAGYNTPHALSVGTIAVGVDPWTVFSQKIVMRSIRLESPDIIFEGGLGGNNLSQILDNINSSGAGSGPPATNPAAHAESQRKYEVDDLRVTGAKVEVVLTGMGQPQEMTLPEIHLTDLGKDSEGITAAELARRVIGAINSATIEMVASDAVRLGKNAATLKQAGENAGKQIRSSFGNTFSNLLNR